jgi:hypothetical protein
MRNDFSNCTDRDSLISYIYDEYKTAHGIRPRWVNFDEMSTTALQQMAQQVSDDCEAAAEYEAQQEAKAVERFEALLADMIAIGAGDRATAVRWLRDANRDFVGYGDDDGEMRYHYGLPYNYQF